ncbi:hypothetical protein [Lichenicoccus roseus]|uniref:Uncharacterized protein n=1 Tax=Lichenicoccus roseus TaxID=2683649 RepID=A0A5R9IZQ1_9PROT|nr:hypothetical protein [Lichenicoccus roseus]TLU70762.1 hypothetical protein FE263_20585 [Lichenicoccus roseus]
MALIEDEHIGSGVHATFLDTHSIRLEGPDGAVISLDVKALESLNKLQARHKLADQNSQVE